MTNDRITSKIDNSISYDMVGKPGVFSFACKWSYTASISRAIFTAFFKENCYQSIRMGITIFNISRFYRSAHVNGKT